VYGAVSSLFESFFESKAGVGHFNRFIWGKGVFRLKKVLSLLLAFLLMMSIVMPAISEADSKLDRINQKLREVQQKQQAAQRNAQKAQSKINSINNTIKKEQQAIEDINADISRITKDLQDLYSKIGQTNADLEKAAVQLAEAEYRVVKRDALLKQRVRLMYENGTVTYIEVLMGSNSFVDFLDRLDALELIVDQDQAILMANINDREQVKQLNIEIESKLTSLNDMYIQAEAYKQFLVDKEKTKQVMIASMEHDKHELEEFKEEEEEAAINLAAEAQKLLAEKKKLQWSGGKLAWPVPDSQRITSNFGMRIHPVTGQRKGHNGMDIGAPKGTTIVAAEDGTVIVAQYLRGYGNTVIIDHGSGLWTLYAHMSKISVGQGDSVKRGKTKIGEVGSTGRSTGNHLHFEVRKNEQPVDPRKYLK
jgi:murein DD-endopeptidase MepM/ murein hydrolase activator NlpD